MGGEGEEGFQPTCPNLPAPGGSAIRDAAQSPPLHSQGVAREGDIAFL